MARYVIKRNGIFEQYLEIGNTGIFVSLEKIKLSIKNGEDPLGDITVPSLEKWKEIVRNEILTKDFIDLITTKISDSSEVIDSSEVELLDLQDLADAIKPLL